MLAKPMSAPCTVPGKSPPTYLVPGRLVGRHYHLPCDLFSCLHRRRLQLFYFVFTRSRACPLPTYTPPQTHHREISGHIPVLPSSLPSIEHQVVQSLHHKSRQLDWADTHPEKPFAVTKFNLELKLQSRLRGNPNSAFAYLP